MQTMLAQIMYNVSFEQRYSLMLVVKIPHLKCIVQNPVSENTNFEQPDLITHINCQQSAFRTRIPMCWRSSVEFFGCHKGESIGRAGKNELQ